ncbi:membrane metallo-endopeptidase-like 1 [Teleopsis dalmanni]|uniref:membrane metallo-endopeptidase-like 1 n=1 Tax=Teleopsis dalmanni TaxID=139649 RepID=UPI0018CF8283|nr:membrane metallo-endopeptidase-like 1 [Teleopsis dalmanni]
MSKSNLFTLLKFLLIPAFWTANAHGDYLLVSDCGERASCLSHINEEIVSLITRNVDNNTSPCENFWKYACGLWSPGPFYDVVDNFGVVNKYYVKKFEDFFETSGYKNEIKENVLLEKLHTYYIACKRGQNAYLPMQEYLQALPLSTSLNWTELIDAPMWKDDYWKQHLNHFNWLRHIAELRRFGLNGIFIDESVGFAFNDSMSSIIEIEMPSDEHNLENNYDLVKSYFALGLTNEISENLIKLSLNLYEFDEELKALRLKYQEEKEVGMILTLQQFKHVVPNIDWQLYFNILLDEVAQPELKIAVSSIDYMRDVAALLSQKDEKIVYMYIQLHLFKYLQDIGSTKSCIDHMGVVMPLGNLPQHAFLQYYNSYYTELNITSSNFFNNHLILLHFRTQQQHSAVVHMKAYNEDEFYVNDDLLQIRNAPYFVHQRNLLIVPLIFMSMPFFHNALNPLFQYSIVGWLLAHEMQHAFEIEGIMYDELGNVNMPLAITTKQQPEFAAAVKCLTRSPTAALIERIADVNGFQLAYDAYFDATNASFPEYMDFSNEFSAKQLYFLNFAQFFCGTLPAPIGHDSDDVRVIETVANMPEFGVTFNCSLGQRENPIEKCQMWR